MTRYICYYNRHHTATLWLRPRIGIADRALPLCADCYESEGGRYYRNRFNARLIETISPPPLGLAEWMVTDGCIAESAWAPRLRSRR